MTLFFEGNVSRGHLIITIPTFIWQDMAHQAHVQNIRVVEIMDRSRPKGIIRGNTKIGSRIGSQDCQKKCDRCGIENKIESFEKQKELEERPYIVGPSDGRAVVSHNHVRQQAHCLRSSSGLVWRTCSAYCRSFFNWCGESCSQGEERLTICSLALQCVNFDNFSFLSMFLPWEFGAVRQRKDSKTFQKTFE